MIYVSMVTARTGRSEQIKKKNFHVSMFDPIRYLPRYARIFTGSLKFKFKIKSYHIVFTIAAEQRGTSSNY